MANEKPAAPAKPAEAPAAPAADAAKKKPMMKMIIMAALVLALEGGTVGLTMVMAGGPKRVVADVPASQPVKVVEKDVEIKLVDAKLPNALGGRLYLYHLQVVATTGEKNKTKVSE